MMNLDALLTAVETDLRAAIETAVSGLVAEARTQLQTVLEAAEQHKAAGMAEVEAQRAALRREIAAMQQHEERHEGRVELDVGGMRYVTSVETLRRVPHTFFDAYFSGRYEVDRCEDGSVFIDRDGSLFGHVLEYLRDGVVSVAEAVEEGPSLCGERPRPRP